ncbi:MAG: hypothetical protein KGI25_02105 [Thaumarchaeota archaeon]|nr:hypothetical protein [Nitrososphaerota archaeon]
MENSDILYREANHFSHSLIWLVVIGITFCSVYFALPQLFEIGSVNSPSETTVVVSSVFLAIGFILPTLLLTIKMRIQVRSDGLYVKILPFQLSFNKISLSGLQNCESYVPQKKEENKLGLRYAMSKKAYSVGGRRGIRLEFKDGNVVLLESRRAEKFIQAIKTVSTSK